MSEQSLQRNSFKAKTRENYGQVHTGHKACYCIYSWYCICDLWKELLL